MFDIVNHPDPAHGKPFPSSRIVELRARIDVWELQRSRGLIPGAETVISANGERVAQLRTLSANRIMVTTDRGETAILLTWDQPMHRCPRFWFQCPSCQKRCRHIYLPELQCRLCLALEHRCRHVLQLSNAARIAWLKRLRGMPQRRSRRYWRLSEQIAREEATLAVGLRRFTKAAEHIHGRQG